MAHYMCGFYTVTCLLIFTPIYYSEKKVFTFFYFIRSIRDHSLLGRIITAHYLHESLEKQESLALITLLW